MADNDCTFDLERLRRLAQALAETTDLNKVKSLRDKAEAARKHIQRSRLGQRLKNVAAEIKLRAERRAGELLSELIPHGGNRRSNGCGRNLRLVDVGIDANQSARWRREAAVPEAVFEQYLSVANELGHDVTASGLLRLARAADDGRNGHQRTESACVKSDGSRGQSCDADVSDLFFLNRAGPQASTSAGLVSEGRIREVLVEVANHRDLLAGILAPICEGRRNQSLPLSQRRIIARLLTDIQGLIHRLERMWFAVDGNREG